MIEISRKQKPRPPVKTLRRPELYETYRVFMLIRQRPKLRLKLLTKISDKSLFRNLVKRELGQRRPIKWDLLRKLLEE